MAYFSTRLRIPVINAQAQSRVIWPAPFEISTSFLPEEVFGSSEVITPRIVVIPGRPTSITVDPSAEKTVASSDEFLPALNLIGVHPNIKSVIIQFAANNIKASGVVSSWDEFMHVIEYVTLVIPAALSLQLKVFIECGAYTGKLAESFPFWSILPGDMDTLHVVSMDEKYRQEKVRDALNCFMSTSPCYTRLLLATFYFQQGLRFISPHKTISAPHFVYAEVLLNLAKSIEILFTSDRDTIRVKCGLLGYTERQIETQIIPVMIIRSNIDVAHAVGMAMPGGSMRIVRKYVERSCKNVSALILRSIRYSLNDESIFEPLSTDGVQDRQKLCDRLARYLEDEELGA